MHTYKEHRERTRARFREEGLDNFTEVHALELLLFYAIPQKDTKPLARELIHRFGSFSNVLEATVEELMAVEGMGLNTATYLTLLNAAGRYHRVNSLSKVEILRDSNEYGNYLVEHFSGRRNEAVMLLCLDAKCKVRGCRLLCEGDVNAIHLPIRKVVETALATNATSVVLAHNHPSGIALPSREDVAVTRQVAAALSAIGVTLQDHVVVANDDFVSMALSGLYRPEDFF